MQENKQACPRIFTVIACKKSQALELRIADLIIMQSEFPLLATAVYQNSAKRLPKLIEKGNKVAQLIKDVYETKMAKLSKGISEKITRRPSTVRK